jgi:hypothetical protein
MPIRRSTITALLLAAVTVLPGAGLDPPVLRADFDALDPAGILHAQWIDDGLGGRALAGRGQWRAGAVEAPDPAGGTIELRLCLLAPAAEVGNWTLLRCRAPGGPEDSYANGIHLIHGWGRGLFLLLGDRTGRLAPLVFADTAAWRPGEWHHCAATWSNPGPGRASAAFWVDDRLVERRERLTIDVDREAWLAAARRGGLDLCAGAVWGKPSPGAIDDLRIYLFPRLYRSDP